MKKDLVLGCFTNYDYSKLQYWINSLKMTGFDGDIVVVVGNASFATVEQLIQKGCKIVAFGRDEETKEFVYPNSGTPIHTERFFHFWNFLKENHQNYRYVITTDMKDVIFQVPSAWLDCGDASFVSAGECIKYKDEPWGRQNLQQAFGPYFYECWKEYEIENVGVVAGQAEYMRDLCLHIFQSSINRPIKIVEQAAYNYLIRTQPFCAMTYFPDLADAWVVNVGTTLCDPNWSNEFGKANFDPFLLEAKPVCTADGIKNAEGELFHIIHQWDRLPPDQIEILKQYYGD